MHATLTPKHQNRSFPARIPALITTFSVAGFDPTEQRTVEPVTLRLYASREALRIHAIAWVHIPYAPRCGYGWASGGGYHRPSAAAYSALGAAGIRLSEDISGRGDDAIRAALLATAAAARPDLIGLEVFSHE